MPRKTIEMKSYLRFLGRNKLYTAIEVVGLSVSLAFVVFTAVFAWDIYTKTWIYPDHEDIYALNALSPFNANYEMSRYLDEIPEIEEHCEMSFSPGRIVVGDAIIGHETYAVSDGFLKMFPKKFIAGNGGSLNIGGSAVITESLAESLFGSVDEALGNSFNVSFSYVTISDVYPLTVTGIIEDYTTEIFDTEILIGIETQEGKALMKANNGLGDQIFVNTGGKISQDDLSEKVHDLIRRHFPKIEETIVMLNFHDCYALRLDDLYMKHTKNGLKGGEMQRLLLIMTLISLTLLLSAILNYINLSFAQTSKRSNMLATMRLVGADRKKIIRDQIIESITMTSICAVFAVLIALACVPMARKMMNLAALNISIGIGSVVLVILVVIIVGGIAGLVPAIMATSYKPIEVAKGTFRKKRKMIFSKVFICVQNSLAATLLVIACCLMADIYSRVNEPMGFGLENVGFIDNVGDRYIDMLQESPYVKNIGYVDKIVQGGMEEYMRDKAGNQISADLFICDTAAFNLMRFHIKENLQTDLQRSVWVTESLMDALGLTIDDIQTGNSGFIFMSPIWADTHFGGIIEDYKIATISHSAYPGLVIADSQLRNRNYLVVETSGDRKEVKTSISEISRKYASDNPDIGFYWTGTPDEMTFYLDDFRESAMYTQRKVMSVVRLFMLIAVFISILGMIGMSSYHANESTRSIAVHKIHGGTVLSETMRNVRAYMMITSLACLIGSPLGLYIVKSYLKEYTYMDISYVLPVAVATAATFLFALAAVLWQTVRAARTNPAEALKKE